MNVLFTVVGHLLHVIAKLMRPGGTRTLIAENLLLKKQMIVLNRGGGAVHQMFHRFRS